MKLEFSGEEVNCVVYEEDGNENEVAIYWKDGNKSKCMLVEEL